MMNEITIYELLTMVHNDEAPQMIRIDSIVHCHSVHVFPDSSLGLFPKIVNQSVLIHHNQTSITLKHNYIIKVYAPV